MRALVVLGVLLATFVAVAPAPAAQDAELPTADVARAREPQSESSLDVNLRLGLNGFRLGTRLFGRDGYAGGAWLNGETRRDGFSLDGRLERDGRAWNFKMNADLDEWVRRAARWWGLMDL